MSSSGITREADARRKAIITVGGGDAENQNRTKERLPIEQVQINRACARFPSRNVNVARQPITYNIEAWQNFGGIGKGILEACHVIQPGFAE